MGHSKTSNSNGAAYADLDNDGDLDLVINNINEPAFIYRNESNGQQHYLQIKLQGAGGNTQGIGTRVMLYYNNQQQYLEQMPSRGYLSTVSAILHAGLGAVNMIDSLRIVWPGGKTQLLKGIKANQLLVVTEKEATGIYHNAVMPAPLFAETTSLFRTVMRLIPSMISKGSLCW
ncbi:ASPIC/UnbV domain-containing protein [Paraflavitalea speifideaquila]|uniref:ASPIC/UnbV domain-containing protein n=1 Tax=Paraflavitalea speifideaquila TaxID=3076558 RepID=UPI0028F14A2B|nr:ASPIC/UnbV domain-containing protein [Paraflavitalea speifideiaquila]